MQIRDDFPTIAFVSFESEFAPVGGLNAVMSRLPRQMARMHPEKAVLLITPFFARIAKSAQALSTGVIKDPKIAIKVPYRGQIFDARVLVFEEKVGKAEKFTIYFIDSTQFFLAPENPYINPNAPQRLFEDSCFLCAAVPEVLKSIPEKPPFLLNLEDWETALVCKTMPSNMSYKCVITLHNPYDNSCEMTLHSPRPRLDPTKGPDELPRLDPGTITIHSTILKQTLPEIAGISTVSENFARELLSDPLQTKVLAPHLQEMFKLKGVIPVNNGIFKDLDPSLARFSKPSEVLGFKINQRGALAKTFATQEGKDLLKRAWGSCDFSDISLPIFLLFGRDDPRQKGFDVAAKAIRDVLEEKGPHFGRFVFTPIPGPRGSGTVAFLERLCQDFPESVLVFPFRLTVGYNELQAAASYFLMCSIYEPFGGANEAYASGVPVVARATGGLVQQVCPFNYKVLPRDVQVLVDEFHGEKRHPTGFLFKEDITNVENAAADWKNIIRANFLDENPIGDAIAERSQFSLYNEMTSAAKSAIIQAVNLFRENPEEYGRCILNGIRLLDRFNWDDAVDHYINDLYTR